jgi:uncharacterized membrane protein
MAFCKICGGQIPDNANNCPNCGAPVNENNQQQQQQQQQYQQANTEQRTFLGEDLSAQFDPSEVDSSDKWAYFLSYLWVLFFLPLVVCPQSKVGRFHANQGLLLLIFSAAVSVTAGVIGAFGFIPYIGGVFSVIAGITGSAGGVVHIVIFIFQLLNILNKKVVEIPIIGKFRLIK